MSYIEVSRRTFVKTAVAAGGGMALGFFVPGLPKALAATTTASPWVEGEGVEINAWLTIDENSIVTIRSPHTEMGQGALTSVAIMIAEALDVPWENVRSVMASANRHVTDGEVYVSTSTGGSNVVRRRHPHIMQAGASARARLTQAADDA